MSEPHYHVVCDIPYNEEQASAPEAIRVWFRVSEQGFSGPDAFARATAHHAAKGWSHRLYACHLHGCFTSDWTWAMDRDLPVRP